MTQWEEAFREYLQGERRASEHTLRSYLADVARFREYFKSLDEGLDWDVVDTSLVRSWVAHLMDEGAQPATVNARLSSLRAFYRFLRLTKLVSHDPVSQLHGPKRSKPLPAFVREGDMNRLLEIMRQRADELANDSSDGGSRNQSSAYEHFNAIRDRVMVLMLYLTGIRRGEIVGLNVRDVDFPACQMRVTGKRNKTRVIPFGEELRCALHEYLAERHLVAGDGEEALFVTSKGKRVGATFVTEMVHRALSEVTTGRKLSPHVLRHTFATAMLNAGADLESVKELLGHESVATTEIYTHATFEQLRETYRKSHPRA